MNDVNLEIGKLTDVYFDILERVVPDRPWKRGFHGSAGGQRMTCGKVSMFRDDT